MSLLWNRGAEGLRRGSGDGNPRQQNDGASAVGDTTQDVTETVEEFCSAEGCDSDRVSSERLPKTDGSYEVRLFTCVDCGHKWRDS